MGDDSPVRSPIGRHPVSGLASRRAVSLCAEQTFPARGERPTRVQHRTASVDCLHWSDFKLWLAAEDLLR